MSKVQRIVTTVVGVFFVLQGVGWLVVPQRAAEGLGMPLLDGLARSTQIGDLAAFFLVGGATMVLGARPGRQRLLYVPASLLLLAAFGRTFAWIVHGASFAATFIAVEVVVAALLLAAARDG